MGKKKSFTINEDKPFLKLFLFAIIIFTLFFILLRIMKHFILDSSSPANLFTIILKGKDVDFLILRNWMKNGIYEFYKPPPGYNTGNLYLYHWYFIFYPFYIIDKNVSLYIWDGLRLASTIFISKKIYELTTDKRDLFIFFIFSAIGYFADCYLNNTNWLIQILLFESYFQLKNEKKILSGILFTIATYKIIALVFPFVLLISKKIKSKELIYYFCPFVFLCIPYVVNISYFIEMYSNWTYSPISDLNLFLRIIFSALKLFEPAQLMFVCLIVLILIININFKDSKSKNRFIIILFIFLLLLLIMFLIFFGVFAEG